MQVSPPPVLLLPGIGNSGPTHWQSLWEQSLPAAKRVQQASWDAPRREDWCDGIEEAVTSGSPSSVVVAHSLGCLAFAFWAKRMALSVSGALLVAPPDPEAARFPSEAKGFTPVPLQTLSFPSIVVASSNDPYASVGFAESCAKAWGSRFVLLGACGHINAESGLGRWDAGLALLQELLESQHPGYSAKG